MNYKRHSVKVFITKNVFYFHFSIDGVLKIVPRLMMIMMVTFLSDVRKQRKKLRETARNLSCVGRISPALQAFENKDVAERALPGAAPRRGLKQH